MNITITGMRVFERVVAALCVVLPAGLGVCSQPPGAFVYGSVVAAEGDQQWPGSDFTVELWDPESFRSGGRPVRTTYTDSTGGYAFQGLPSGEYILTVSAFGGPTVQKVEGPPYASDRRPFQEISVTSGKVEVPRITIKMDTVLDRFSVGYYRLISLGSGKCADVKDRATSEGVRLQQYRCIASENQAFEIKKVGEKTYNFVAAHSGLCLDFRTSTAMPGSIVEQDRCDGGTSQLFTIKSEGNDLYSIVTVDTGECLDVKGRSAEDHAPIQRYRCHGGRNQLWRILPFG